MTRLSVVVPCYDVEAYAAQTIRSLGRNAAPGIEFLLVDDASTDRTRSVLESHAAALPGARVIVNPVNRGLSATRNVGVEAATGDYLTFLDGDDFVAAGYYPTLLCTIERLGCDMVRTDHVQVRGSERTVHCINHGPRRVVSSPRDAILPVNRATSVDAPNAWAGIYHRRLADAGLLHFDEGLRTCEDRPWNWRLHLRAGSFAVVGLLGVFYRRDISTSLTQLADERQFDFIKAFDQIVAMVEVDRDAAVLLPKVMRSYAAMILHHLGQSDRYPMELAEQLVELCRAALLRLPRATIRRGLSALQPERADQLTRLMAGDVSHSRGAA